MAREIREEELEEYIEERREWESSLQKGRVSRRKAAGSGSSLPPKRGGGGGVICAYPDCDKEATALCEQCHLPYCQFHVSPERHSCIGCQIYEVISRYDKGRVVNLGSRFIRDFTIEKPIRFLSKEEVIPALSRVLPLYSKYCRDFLSIVNKETLIGFIIARLVLKIIEYAQKYGNVIIMDNGLYDEIVSGFPSHTPFTAGVAFQWWLTLEILDSIQEKLHYSLEWLNPYDRIARISKGYKPVKSAYVFLDSKRVQKDVGVRPDVLSSREGVINMRSGKVLEIKLSWEALQSSVEQIYRYYDIWGEDNIMIAIGLPVYQLMIMPYRCIDNLLFLSNECLQQEVNGIANFLEP